MIRDTARILRSAEINFAYLKSKYSVDIDMLSTLFGQIQTARRAKGLVQHHDSLAGFFNVHDLILKVQCPQPRQIVLGYLTKKEREVLHLEIKHVLKIMKDI